LVSPFNGLIFPHLPQHKRLIIITLSHSIFSGMLVTFWSVWFMPWDRARRFVCVFVRGCVHAFVYACVYACMCVCMHSTCVCLCARTSPPPITHSLPPFSHLSTPCLEPDSCVVYLREAGTWHKEEAPVDSVLRLPMDSFDQLPGDDRWSTLISTLLPPTSLSFSLCHSLLFLPLP
jgi:hypothetical protein